MLEKIRYRLVYNRQNRLNRQGTALVQIEAYLNQRKSYFKTNIYLNRSVGVRMVPKLSTIRSQMNLTQCYTKKYWSCRL